LQQVEVREKLRTQGGKASGMMPEQFAALLKFEFAKWGKVVKASRAKPD
jgi:tripartite-type tricarboxylate transporter receptor subunit TctC